MECLKVFISSTWMDMIAEREAVEIASNRLRSIRFVGMEYFGSRSESTRETSLDEVDRCDIYVGILGHRYGSGITEAEYRRAVDRGLPCLIYLKDSLPAAPAQSETDAGKLASWYQEMRARHTVSLFKDPQELAARVVADLHNLVFDRLIVQGIGQLRAGYETRIQRFLAEYVGTVDAPIAFGGREQELETLDRWLDDPRAPPFAMLGGPAGRGKSALLVHWAQRLMGQADVSLIYFPVSIRFRTNLASVAFASITARLAALHGEALPAGQETPAEVWRELMSAYLRRAVPEGRRFVLILDGIDEGADLQPGPDLFPAKPPERLRVLVSARYVAGDVDARGWMARLGWTRPRSALPLDLSPLTPMGLVDVLRRMSVPLELLSARADVVAELFRLSRGDPLLVNLYVADLWSRGEAVARLQPEDLAGLQPGLDGYFQRWWDDQRALWGAQSPLREPAVNGVLNTLACALGPLHTAELLELLPAGSGVEFWALDDIMQALRRFVLGDGDIQGYALSHPRLGDYFYERLAKAGRAQAQELRFVSWGLGCLEDLEHGRRPSTEVPGYLLHYLRLHMERAGSAPETFLALASKAWASASGQLDNGSYVGFLGDLARVNAIATGENSRRAAQGQPLPFLGSEIRCALCAASIRTLAAEMSVGLLKALVEREVWTPEQAIAYATRIPGTEARLRGLFELAAALPGAYRPLAQAAALVEIRALVTDEPGRRTLAAVLHHLFRPIEPNGSAAETARLFEAVAQIARQGLVATERRWIIDTLAEAALSFQAPLERIATVLGALSPWLNEPAATRARFAADRALRKFTESGGGADLFLGGVHLPLFPAQPVDGPEPWLTEALRAGLGALTAACVGGATALESHLELLLRCWRYLPDIDVEELIGAIAPLLTPPLLDTLLAGIERELGLDRRLQPLMVLLYRVSAELRGRVAPAVSLALREGQGLESDIFWLLRLAGDVEGSGELVAFLVEIASALTPSRRIGLLAALARAHPDPELRGRLAVSALEALPRLTNPDKQREAFVALLDELEPPGSGDSFEHWRIRREWHPLPTQIRQILRLGRPARGEILATAQHLLGNPGQVGPHLEMQRRLALAAGSLDAPRESAAAAAAPSPPAAALLDQYRIRNPKPKELAAMAAAGEPPRGFAETLRLLAEVAGAIPADTVRQAVAEVMGDYRANGYPVATPELVLIPGIVAFGPLYPPVAETLDALRALAQALCTRVPDGPGALDALLSSEPMPDLVRHELLAAALLHHTRSGKGGNLGPALTKLLLAVCDLAHPPDELVDLALDGVRKEQDAAKTSPTRWDVLDRLMPFIRRRNLPRWLEVAGSLSVLDIRFVQVGLGEGACAWRQIIDAIGQFPSAQRARWLLELAPWLSATLAADAVNLARGIREAPSRLAALCAVLPAIPPAQRRAVLPEALDLARRTGPSEIGLALVQMVIDAKEASASLLAEATATAMALSDPVLRGRALARLAAVLPPEQLGTLATASLRLDDAAGRVRAMRSLVLAVVDPALRATAVDKLLSSVAELPPGNPRNAAMLYVAPLIEPAARWPALDTALRTPTDRSSGFEYAELFEALRDALPNAPARLMAQVFPWIRHAPASASRSRLLAGLVPTLPSGQFLSAIVLIAQGPDEESVALLADYLSADDLARAHGYRQTLPESARTLLSEITRIHATARRPISDRPTLSCATSELLNAVSRGFRSEVERAAVIRRFALDRNVSSACRGQLVEATRCLGDRPLRRATTAYLAGLAADRSLGRAREAVMMIASAGDRSLALLSLALRHPGPMRDNLLDGAFAAAGAEPEALPRLAAAVEIGVAAPVRLPQVLECIDSVAQPEPKARALSELTLRVADEDAAAVVVESLRLLGEDRFGRMTMDVAPALGPLARRAALAALPTLRKDATRVRLLVALVPHLDAADQATCVAVMETVRTDFAWIEALGALSQRWPALLTHERATAACATLNTIGDRGFAASWLEQAAAYWPPSAWPEFLEATHGLSDPALVCDVLGAGVRACAGQPPAGFLSAARQIGSGFHRSVVLGLAGSVREPADTALLAEALQVAASAQPRDLYLDALVAMVETSGTVAMPVFDALLAAFRGWPLRVGQAWIDVSPWLHPDQAAWILGAMEPAGLGGISTLAADLLFGLAPQLLPEDLPRLLQEIPRFCSARAASSLLCDLAPLILDDASRAAALAAALSIPAATFRSQALMGLAGNLNPQQQREMIIALTDTPLEAERVRRLAKIWPDIAADARGLWRERAASVRDPDLAGILEMYTREAGHPDQSPPVPPASAGDFDADTDRSLDALFNELTVPKEPASGSGEWAARSSARTPSGFDELVARFDRIEAEGDRLDELIRALPTLPAADILGVVDVLPHYLASHRHDEALLRIVAFLPCAIRGKVLPAVGRIQDPSRLRRVLPVLLPQLGEGVLTELHALWRDAMQSTRNSSRGELFVVLEVHAPVISALGGDTALLHSLGAMDDVGRLWP